MPSSTGILTSRITRSGRSSSASSTRGRRRRPGRRRRTPPRPASRRGPSGSAPRPRRSRRGAGLQGRSRLTRVRLASGLRGRRIEGHGPGPRRQVGVRGRGGRSRPRRAPRGAGSAAVVAVRALATACSLLRTPSRHSHSIDSPPSTFMSTSLIDFIRQASGCQGSVACRRSAPGWWNGRRDGLKRVPHGRVGSNPAPGTDCRWSSPECPHAAHPADERRRQRAAHVRRRRARRGERSARTASPSRRSDAGVATTSDAASPAVRPTHGRLPSLRRRQPRRRGLQRAAGLVPRGRPHQPRAARRTSTCTSTTTSSTSRSTGASSDLMRCVKPGGRPHTRVVAGVRRHDRELEALALPVPAARTRQASTSGRSCWRTGSDALVEAHPGDFLRGLFHSDGCRVTNCDLAAGGRCAEALRLPPVAVRRTSSETSASCAAEALDAGRHRAGAQSRAT